MSVALDDAEADVLFLEGAQPFHDVFHLFGFLQPSLDVGSLRLLLVAGNQVFP